MSTSNEHESINLRDEWWSQYTTLYEDMMELDGILRHGVDVVRGSDFSNQFYCEQQLDHRLSRIPGFKTWDMMTSSINLKHTDTSLYKGVKGHEAIRSDSDMGELSEKQVWHQIINGMRVMIYDPLLIGKFQEIYLSGHPDAVIFENGKPVLVLEYKFSAKPIPSAWHHSQVGFYCYLLGEMGFNVANLLYVIGIFPPESFSGEELNQVTDKILESLPFNRTKMEIPEGIVNLYSKLYDPPDTSRELNWAVDYWRCMREPVPTKIDWKCRACTYCDVCEFSLA